MQPQSAYCAGFHAINTLKKSDLAFSFEEVSVSFKVGCVCEKVRCHFKRNKYKSYLYF